MSVFQMRGLIFIDDLRMPRRSSHGRIILSIEMRLCPRKVLSAEPG